MAFNNVGALTVSLLGDVNSASKGLDKISKKVETFGTKVTAIGKRVGAAGKAMTAGITLPLVGFGTAAVKFASDAEEIQSKFEAVFKETSGDVSDWIEVFSQAVNRNATDLKNYAATFQDTFVPLGFARDDAAEMSKKLVELTVDLASFNNESEPETMKALQSAIVGNTETVRRYGVIITQAALDQELLNMGIEGGVNVATEAEKAQARLNLIIAGTADAQGDATRTAGSFANQMKGLKAQLKSISEEIGNFLIPYIKEIIKKIQDWLQAWKDLRVEDRARVIKAALVLGALGPLLVVLGKILVIMPKLATAMSLLAGHPILVAIGLITTAFLTLYNTVDEFRYFWDDVWVGIVNTAKTAANTAILAINGVSDAINLLIKGINLIPGINIPGIEKIESIDLTSAVTEFDKIREALKQINKAVGDVPTTAAIAEWKKLTDAIVEKYGKMYPELKAIQEKALADLESGAETSIEKVNKTMRKAIEASGDASATIAENVATDIDTTSEFISTGMQFQISELENLLGQMAVRRKKSLDDMAAALKGFTDRFDDLNNQLHATTRGTIENCAVIAKMRKLYDDVSVAVTAAGADASESMLKLQADIKTALDKATEDLDGTKAAWKEFWAGRKEDLKTSLGDMFNRWGDYRKTHEAEETEHLANMKKIRDNAEGLTAKEQKAAFEAEKTRYENQRTTVQSILGDMVRDVLESLRAQLLVKAASTLVDAIASSLNPLTAALAPGLYAAAAEYATGGAALAIAGFEHGGTVPGPPGEPIIIEAHGGERVLTREQQLIDYRMIGKAVAAGTYDAMKEVMGQDSGRPIVVQVGEAQLARVMYPALVREGQRLGVTG